MTLKSQETTNALTEAEIKSIHEEIGDLRKKIDGLENEKQSAYRYGIALLGMGVLALGSWIFTFVMGHPK